MSVPFLCSQAIVYSLGKGWRAPRILLAAIRDVKRKSRARLLSRPAKLIQVKAAGVLLGALLFWALPKDRIIAICHISYGIWHMVRAPDKSAFVCRRRRVCDRSRSRRSIYRRRRRSFRYLFLDNRSKNHSCALWRWRPQFRRLFRLPSRWPHKDSV